MSEHPIVHIPQAAVWLLRLAANTNTGYALLQNQVAFACWYASVGEALPWPDDVKKIQETERAKKMPMERMVKLLGDVSHVFASRMNSDQARRVLEGYAVNEWAKRHVKDFYDAVQKIREAYEDSLDYLEKYGDSTDPMLAFARNLKALCEALNLSELESEILSFAFLTAASDEVSNVFKQSAQDRWTAERLWTVVFNTDSDALAKALGPTSPLRLSGMVQSSGQRTQMVTVSGFWVDLLARAKDLKSAVLEPMTDKIGSGMPAKLLPEDAELAAEILKNAEEAGVNLLLYSSAKLEKQQLVHDLAKNAGRKPWRIAKFQETNRTDLPALTYLAFALLAEEKDEELPPVLVIERPSDALHTSPSAFLQMVFGIEVDQDIADFDEHLLGNNKVPGIWLSSNVAQLPDETVARFVFHAPLQKADKKERVAALERRLKGLKLTKDARERILKLEGVSSAQVDSALKVARLRKTSSRKEHDAVIVQAILRSQRALQRDLQAKVRTPVTQYSLKYLNTAGRFTPQQIMECLGRTGKGSLVLYGPPGTGKTQFVEHMAVELGKPLLSKRASELLSKYVGEAEKNIAAAFEEAATEGAILLLDEGDSFLRERSNAQHSWEVTQVNELLVNIERFEGIVVVCTNLFNGLDAAALRRFTFKIEFSALHAEQRWEMFVNETGLRGQLSQVNQKVRDDWNDRLCLMRNLTAGDFATVKRQCILLDTKLTPEQWLEQLQIEVDVKNKPTGERAKVMSAL